MVRNRLIYGAAWVVAIVVVSVGIIGPLRDAAVASDAAGPAVSAPVGDRADVVIDVATEPAPKGFTDEAARVSFDPPVGGLREPAPALNPQSDPPDPAQELVRFQLRLDASLYAFPVPVTSALVRDAGAIITVGVARAGGDCSTSMSIRAPTARTPPPSRASTRSTRSARTRGSMYSRATSSRARPIATSSCVW